ncbi:GNAT family N-acetyltransferase [Macrococcus hajekii]|uniref:GNAT family N-acetyltransferase n=1 Tax=Macrococcus hajekii TaxID=198482 RepID=A0A4R6BJ68_9STAP|nr:GNAT family N-acetyltransferase [Macrococcus hajekii]TDM01742.1 GNAT family N-acetyltransferase [Macrococcus hajekii]GGB07043.1 acetyltransferase [Macrococcus hajekii]
MEFKVRELHDLTPEEVLDIMEERIKVFVIEQGGNYREIDDYDRTCKHVLIEDGDKIAAYARIIDTPDYVKFGRVLVPEAYRKQKLGRQIVQFTIDEIQRLYPGKLIKISAQAYLKDFYKSFGFEVTSDVYEIINIPHIDMELD